MKPRALASHPFSGSDMWSLVEARAAHGADRPSLIWQPFDQPSVEWTFAELARDAQAVAAGLQRRGVRAGDRVLIHLDNCPEFILAWLACAAVGATAVTTNTRSTLDELSYAAGDSEPVAAITQPRHAELVSAAAPDLRWLACTDHDVGVAADNGSRPDRASSFDELRGDPRAYTRIPIDPLRRLSVQYTSGTTARPKGVVWTHANGLWSARVNATHEGLRPSDCHLVYLPLFHSNAMAFGVLPSLLVGSRFVLTPKWSTRRFWDLSRAHECTWLSLIGLSLRAILNLDTPKDHSYRMFGGPVSVDAFPGVGVKTIGWWGMTETTAHGIVGDAHLPNRYGAMGRPAPEYGIAVLRPDGTTVDPGETGELAVKGIPGLSLFAEYLGQPEATADSFDDMGWFRTGDLVVPHADGHIAFVDRGKDMLKVGAENVAASEIERVIAQVPGVVEVGVVGRPDDKLDEVPVAFVVAPSAGDDLEASVIAACTSMLSDFKVPRAVYTVAELPRSTINKVNKVALRAVAEPDADRAGAEAHWISQALVDPSGDAV